MSALVHERSAFAPPPPRGTLPAVMLALLAHGLLAVILTIGVQWKRNASDSVMQAEIWATVPVEAAPPAPPEKVEPPQPTVPPQAKPVEATQEIKAQADIALARDKEKAKQEKKEKELAEKALQAKQEALKREKEAKDKEKADKEKLAKATAEAKPTETAKAKAQEQARLEAARQEQLKRIAGLAGSTGDSNATGTALQNAGPSASYLNAVGARIKQRIVFTDAQKNATPGNPELLIDLRVAPNGSLLEPEIVKSSGYKEWDDAVVSAIRATATVPRDSNGTFPARLPYTFRPKD